MQILLHSLGTSRGMRLVEHVYSEWVGPTLDLVAFCFSFSFLVDVLCKIVNLPLYGITKEYTGSLKIYSSWMYCTSRYPKIAPCCAVLVMLQHYKAFCMKLANWGSGPISLKDLD